MVGAYTYFIHNEGRNWSRNDIFSIVHIALVVKDYDEAIEFYTKKLNFTKLYQNFETVFYIVQILGRSSISNFYFTT